MSLFEPSFFYGWLKMTQPEQDGLRKTGGAAFNMDLGEVEE